jgi:hypothetical protein
MLYWTNGDQNYSVPCSRSKMLASHCRDPGSIPDVLGEICGRQNVAAAGFSPSSLVFPLLVIISPLLHTHLSPPHKVCNSADQAAHYHTLGTKLGASSLTVTWLVLEQRWVSLWEGGGGVSRDCLSPISSKFFKWFQR